jgi:hypothetical protein
LADYERERAAHEQNGIGYEPEMPKEDAPQKIKIVMMAKGMEPYKIFAKSTTLLDKMINSFCNSRSVPEGKDVSLFFDGERLDPESTVGDTEIDDMDTVEVHIK